MAADIASLPFADGSFDVCVCVDTYEHLPASSRAAACREILRVLCPTGVAVVAFPSGKPAEQAEQIIRDAYRALTSAPLSWLEEHASEGLPDADEIARVFAEAGGGAFSVTCTKNATLWVWRWMWRVLMCNWPGRGNALFQAALRLSTPVVCRMHFGTCYRAVVWIQCKNGSR